MAVGDRIATEILRAIDVRDVRSAEQVLKPMMGVIKGVNPLQIKLEETGQLIEEAIVEYMGPTPEAEVRVGVIPLASGNWLAISMLGGGVATGGGAVGPPGPAGTPGEKWFTGAGAPSGAIGAVNDWYLDSANGDYYEKTGASTWTLAGNLRGPTGASGSGGGGGWGRHFSVMGA